MAIVALIRIGTNVVEAVYSAPSAADVPRGNFHYTLDVTARDDYAVGLKYDPTTDTFSAMSVTGPTGATGPTGPTGATGATGAAPTKTFANPARTLNNIFQVSASSDAFVSYSVDVACTLSLVAGQQGTVYLRYADNSGFTTNVVEVARFVNGNTGTLTVGLSLTQNATGTLSGIIPAGKYVQLVTQNNTGTPTFTFRSAQEVLF